MAEDRASIDGSSVLDNIDERQVEFTAELSGDPYDFALKYAVLEALSGGEVGEDDNAEMLFEQFREEIEGAAARAAARAAGSDDVIDIDESDIT